MTRVSEKTKAELTPLAAPFLTCKQGRTLRSRWRREQ